MPNSAYMVITDISGYTAFLTQAELEHAQDIMEGLFKALLDSIEPPLLISKPEGDALFCYAPDGSFLQGQTLLESLENTYFAFRNARERMKLNTTCTCKACTLIPSLDLKFVVHYGAYMFQQIANIKELQGPDVILVHRLLKNSIKETTGCQAYAFFSQAAAERLPLGEMAATMKTHAESYEHIGEVKGYVHDLHVMFERERERRHSLPPPEDTWFEHSVDIAAPPALVWDYITEPERRYKWMHVDQISIENRQAGRVGVGSGMHCEHGAGRTLFNVADWKPFEHIVFDVWPGSGMWAHNSIKLTPIEGGTRVTYIFGKLRGVTIKGRSMAALAPFVARSKIEGDILTGNTALREMIEADLAAGQIVVQPPVEPTESKILATA